MKYRVCIFVLVLAAMFLIWRFWPRQNGLTTSEAGRSNPTLATNIERSTQAHLSNSAKAQQEALKSPTGPAEILEKGKIAVAMQEMNIPLDFYGKVIDQDGNPLSGVKVQVRVPHWSILAPEGSLPLTTESSANGGFHLHGATGSGFTIESVQKDNYEIEPTRLSYGPTNNATIPVVFKMWAADSHEKLITGDKSFKILPDGRSYYVNLENDTISESGPGDLKLWVNYATNAGADGNHDWSCEIDVVNGGLAEEADPGLAMYQAPTNGYTNSFSAKHLVRDWQGGSIGDKRFYLQFEGGQKYGRMSIDLIAPYNKNTPGLVRLRYAINPSGSQVLR